MELEGDHIRSSKVFLIMSTTYMVKMSIKYVFVTFDIECSFFIANVCACLYLSMMMYISLSCDIHEMNTKICIFSEQSEIIQ